MNTPEKTRLSFPVLLFAAGVLPFMLLLVAPLSFYLGNTNEIIIRVSDVVLPVAATFAALTLLPAAALWLVRRHRRSLAIVTGLLLGLSLAVWIQSQLLVWNFGPFNGQPKDWSRWNLHMILEGAIWVAAVSATVFLLFRKGMKAAKPILTGLYLAGLISVTAHYVSAPRKITLDVSDTQIRNIFTFHPEKNVVIIILDTFQSDYFEYILDHYPDEVSAFDGFTFYRNTTSRFPTTRASLPSILTGVPYRNDRPFLEYLVGTWNRYNMAEAYRKKNYQSAMVGFGGTAPEIFSMKEVVDRMGNHPVEPLYEYFDFAMFRAAPTCLKPKIYNDGFWYLTNLTRDEYPPDLAGTDLRFINFFGRKAAVSDTLHAGGAFRLYHFSLPHPPLTVNEELRFDTTLAGREGYISQARGAVRLASGILEKMKDLGIYVNAEIAVISDHGTHAYARADMDIDSVAMFSPAVLRVQNSSHALLLHKPARSEGAMIRDDRPLQSSDLLCLLGVCNADSICGDYRTAMAGGDRIRSFFFYPWEDNWTSEHIPDMTEYRITGDARYIKNYRKGNYLITAHGKIEAPEPKPYQTGDTIIFKAGRGAEAYCIDGWSGAEIVHTWTDDFTAGIAMKLTAKPQHDLVLHLWGAGFCKPGETDRQKVKVYVNGTHVATWTMQGLKHHTAPVPAELVSDRRVNVLFEIGNPGSTPTDGRLLGMAVRMIILEEEKP